MQRFSNTRKKKQKEAIILKDVYLYPNSSLSNFEQGNVQRYRRYVISTGDWVYSPVTTTRSILWVFRGHLLEGWHHPTNSFLFLILSRKVLALIIQPPRIYSLATLFVCTLMTNGRRISPAFVWVSHIYLLNTYHKRWKKKGKD